jgi:hypothetical protein
VPLRGDADFSWTEIPYVAWSFVYGYTLGPPLRDLHLDRSARALAGYLPVIAAGGLAAAVLLLAGLRAAGVRGRLGFLAALALVPLALAVLLAARDVKTFHPRYLIAFFPVFPALLAAGAVHGGRPARIAGIAVVALVAVSLGRLWFDPAYAKEDSRAAARLVRENEQPGDAVVVIYSFRPFKHYFADTGSGRARLHHVHKRFLRTDRELGAHVEEASLGSGRVWLVLSRWWEVAPEQRIRDAFEARLTEAGRWEFPGIKVTLYDGRRA